MTEHITVYIYGCKDTAWYVVDDKSKRVLFENTLPQSKKPNWQPQCQNSNLT